MGKSNACGHHSIAYRFCVGFLRLAVAELFPQSLGRPFNTWHHQRRESDGGVGHTWRTSMVDYLGLIVRNEERGGNCRLYRLIPCPCPAPVSRAHCPKPSHLANHRHSAQLSLISPYHTFGILCLGARIPATHALGYGRFQQRQHY